MTRVVLTDQQMSADELLALDLVLGALKEPDLSAAKARSAADLAFAAMVRKHMDRLAIKCDPPEAGPPGAQVWAEIHRRIDHQDH